MKRHPIVIRRTPMAKAVALPPHDFISDRGLAILLILLLLALTSCIEKSDGEPIDYGPAVSVAELNTALTTPIQDMDPVNIKVGEFRAIENSQEIIGYRGRQLLSAQGVTITAGTETTDKIIFTAVITDVDYKSDGQVDKVSREGPVCVSKIPGACGEETVPSPGSMVAKSFTSPTAFVEKTIKALATSVTYHRMKTSTAVVSVPESVAARANCGGVTDCKMTIYNVGFDQVVWTNGKGERVHIDVVLSPSVPYLSNQLQACFTGQVAVGKSSNVLVKQCSSVYDFRFGSN